MSVISPYMTLQLEVQAEPLVLKWYSLTEAPAWLWTLCPIKK